MKTALLFILALCLIAGCMSPAQLRAGADSPITNTAVGAGDAALGVLAPEFARLHAGQDSLKAAIDKVEEDRRNEGKPAEAPLSSREWVEIGGLTLLGLLGLDSKRNAKYVKAAKAT